MILGKEISPQWPEQLPLRGDKFDFGYFTFRVTVAEDVTWCVLGEPHPVVVAASVTATTRPSMKQTRRNAVILFLAPTSGSKRMGSKPNAAATPGTLSVNTTVT
jgi:hypothetical protein